MKRLTVLWSVVLLGTGLSGLQAQAAPTFGCPAPEHRQFEFWVGDWNALGANGTQVGTNRIELVPLAGSDCRLALLSAGGPFPSLPCVAVYELEGTR